MSDHLQPRGGIVVIDGLEIIDGVTYLTAAEAAELGATLTRVAHGGGELVIVDGPHGVTALTRAGVEPVLIRVTRRVSSEVTR